MRAMSIDDHFWPIIIMLIMISFSNTRSGSSGIHLSGDCVAADGDFLASSSAARPCRLKRVERVSDCLHGVCLRI